MAQSEPLSGAFSRELETELRLRGVIGVAWRALKEIADHEDCSSGYWQRGRAMIALGELEDAEGKADDA